MQQNPLLPSRHPDSDLFILDVGDVVLKDDLASMEHPIFSLSKKPDFNQKIYEHNGNRIEVSPGFNGMANIYDKDILIFAISHIIDAKNQDSFYSKDVIFDAHDFLIFSNRYTGGRDYKLLKDALERLAGTRIVTNIKTNEEEIVEGFGLIDKFRVKTKLSNGTIVSWRITLSDWLFNAIEANEVLTINKEYFRLRKPLERRVYEIARKHCGAKDSWKIGIDLLQRKCGSTSPKRKFRFMLKTIVEHQHLPDYDVFLVDDMVTFYRTGEIGTTQKQKVSSIEKPTLKSSTYEKARKICAGIQTDIYALEYEWWNWAHDKAKPKNGYDAAFLGFVKRKVEKT